MKTTFTVASIAILSMGFNSAAATAEENDKRWYATADFGLSSLSSATLTYSDGTNVETANAKFDDSFASGATVGYRFGR